MHIGVQIENIRESGTVLIEKEYSVINYNAEEHFSNYSRHLLECSKV